MASWPYGTSAWRNLRAAKLRETPFCEPCAMRGRSTPANTVDHRKAISAGGDPFPALSGLMSMCSACHNAKTWGTDRRGGRGVALPGCDANGFPIDPNHPAYGVKGDTPCKDKQELGQDRLRARAFTKFPARGIP